LNYPNAVDLEHSDPRHPGSDIFIHGNRVSAGCMAMTDPVIDVIYGLASHARASGQKRIPVSIFPCRMTSANWAALRKQYASRPDLIKFWSSLLPGYESFERDRMWYRPHRSSGQYTWPEFASRRSP
jgi:murein L,D-transpeptidase YafK